MKLNYRTCVHELQTGHVDIKSIKKNSFTKYVLSKYKNIIGTEHISCQHLVCMYARIKVLFLYEFNMPIIYYADVTADFSSSNGVH